MIGFVLIDRIIGYGDQEDKEMQFYRFNVGFVPPSFVD
jgi:hypothetical protein